MIIRNTALDIQLPTPVKYFMTAKGELLSRKLLAVDIDYDLDQLAKIFSHGASNYKIWFLNRKKKLCVIDSAEIKNSMVYLTFTFDVYGAKKVVHLTLDKFLYLVEVGDFVIKNSKFSQVYMQPYFAANKFKLKY